MPHRFFTTATPNPSRHKIARSVRKSPLLKSHHHSPAAPGELVACHSVCCDGPAAQSALTRWHGHGDSVRDTQRAPRCTLGCAACAVGSAGQPQAAGPRLACPSRWVLAGDLEGSGDSLCRRTASVRAGAGCRGAARALLCADSSDAAGGASHEQGSGEAHRPGPQTPGAPSRAQFGGAPRAPGSFDLHGNCKTSF